MKKNTEVDQLALDDSDGRCALMLKAAMLCLAEYARRYGPVHVHAGVNCACLFDPEHKIDVYAKNGKPKTYTVSALVMHTPSIMRVVGDASVLDVVERGTVGQATRAITLL